MKNINIILPVALLSFALTACNSGSSSNNTPTNNSTTNNGTSNTTNFIVGDMDITAKRGETTKMPVSITRLNKQFSQPITLSASGLPEGVSVSFSNNPVTPQQDFTVIDANFNVAASVPRGDYVINFIAQNGASVSSEPMHLTVDWGSNEVPYIAMRSTGRTVEALVTSSTPIAKVEWYVQGQLVSTQTTGPYIIEPQFPQKGTYDYKVEAVVTDTKGAVSRGNVSGKITVG